MKKESKTLLRKISQAGSMMVEAMAMLALISLVTPTLYKKSAERTTELQDINTATHLRTIMKAVDSYVSANYQSLLEDQLKAEDSSMEIDLSSDSSQIAQGIHDFFPYGYKFDEVKNFDAPKVVLKRQGMSITSFVELPQKTDIGDMRSARIASMIGSNGGYVDVDGNAQGVGGVWSLDAGELNTLGLEGSKGSIVVASSDAINSATSGALENEKYLQRTEVESTDQLWRNTMVTDLYMGGVTGADDMHKILGVDQIILGSTNWEAYENHADLVLTNDNNYDGSAWMAGTLSALSDSFTISGDIDHPALSFGVGSEDVAGNDGELLYINSTEASIYNNLDGFGKVGLLLKPGVDATMETDYATTISNTLDVTGNTNVASGDTNTTFKAGPDGSYITADANRIGLMDGEVEVSRGEDGTEANIKTATTNITSPTTNITGKARIGASEDSGRAAEIATNAALNVQGSAYVRDNLEVGNTLYAEKFNTKELHAGGSSFTDNPENRWLHATADGVEVTNPDNPTDPILQINSIETLMFGPHGENAGESSAVILGSNTGQMRGVTRAELYTTDTTGTVDIQDGSLVLTGRIGGENGNRVDFNADTTTVNDGIFRVTGTTGGGDDLVATDAFYVDPSGDADVKIDSGELTIDSNPLFRVLPNRESATPQAVAEIDDESFRISTLNGPTSGGDTLSADQILYVDALNYDPKDEGERELTNDASVYIRRGVMELEVPNEGNNYAADSGIGYIEANRFVSNATYNGSLTTPGYANDYTNSNYYAGGEARAEYDRYMVNPAYTSVMHDIKLTTRGGARLSDILPDFINKGIYVVNNSYRDTGINLSGITVSLSGGQLTPTGGGTFDDNASGTLSGAAQWGSPFMGVVPAPQCPPGYARVITITPAGFQMAQAGPITRQPHDVADDYNNNRFVVDEYTEINKLGRIEQTLGSDQTVTGAQYYAPNITDEAGNQHQLYYLGHTQEPTLTVNGSPYSPQPLYFQQSTWLRSKVQPQALNQAGSCNDSYGSGEGCGENFAGWSAIMGFVYPDSFYGDLIDKIGTASEDVDGLVYWNVFPVRRNTLEAYATVYCYFDRTNIYGSGNNPLYVDQYDQLNNYRSSHSKYNGGTNNEGSNSGDNDSYLERLEDPALQYNDPW